MPSGGAGDLLPDPWAGPNAIHALRTLMVPEDTRIAGNRSSAIIRYTVARLTRSRWATSRTVR